MTCGDFIGNLEGLNEGGDFPRELLKVGGGAGHGQLEGRVSEKGRARGPASRAETPRTQPGYPPPPQPRRPALRNMRTGRAARAAHCGRRGGGSESRVIRRRWALHLSSLGPRLRCPRGRAGSLRGVGAHRPSLPPPQGLQDAPGGGGACGDKGFPSSGRALAPTWSQVPTAPLAPGGRA